MKTKVCTKCNTEKDVTEFMKQPTGKYGVFSICKVCKHKLNKEWRENNKEKVISYSRKYYQKNIEKGREKSRKYYQKNKENESEKYRIYYQKNKEKILKRNLKRKMDRYYSDHTYRCTCAIKSLIRKSIITNGYSKDSRTFEVLGCTYEEFKEHIESHWEDWMSWNNYGLYNGKEKYGWDLDHIVPISSAECEEDIIRLNHHSNIQPLCSYVNRCVKKDIIDWES